MRDRDRGKYCVQRGGAWYYNSYKCRCGIRGIDLPRCESSFEGFRVVIWKRKNEKEL